MKYLHAILSFVIVSSISAQTLNGIITLQNSGKKPVSGAQIISEGANPVISQNDGKFGLLYANKNKGDDIFLKVEKEGYEVVNHKDLYTRLREDENDMLSLYMCLKGELETRRMKYYGIQEEYITKRYREELEKLRQEKKDTWDELKTLDEQRKKAIEYAKELAERFSTTNLDDCSQRYRDAFAAFEKGEIVKAISLLKESDNDFLRAQKEIDDVNTIQNISSVKMKFAKANRKQAIDCYVLKADLYILQYQFIQATAYYQKAADADTSAAEVQFKCGYYFHSLNQHKESEFYYLRCLRLTRNDNNAAGVSNTLNSLGILLREVNEIARAKECYKEAFFIRVMLAGENPDIYLPHVAATLNNWGMLLYANSEYKEAKDNYEKALHIYELLGKKHGTTYLPDAGMTLINLGNLLKVNNEITEAKKRYEEALQTYRVLASKNSVVYLPFVASTLNNLGVLFYDNNLLAEAKDRLEEALSIRKNLSERNPDVYLPDLAITLNNLGNLSFINNSLIKAESLYKECMQIYRKIADKNPDVYLPSVALTLNNLGTIQRRTERFTDSKVSYEEALLIYRRLAEKSPGTFMAYVAVTLNNLGTVLYDAKDFEGAKKKYEEALDIYKKLALKSPGAYVPYVATVLTNLGLLFHDSNDYEKAKESYDEALTIRKELAKENPAVFLPQVATTLNSKGALSKTKNELDEAKKDYEEAILIYRNLAVTNPLAYNLDVVMIAINLSLLYETLIENTGNRGLKVPGLKLMEEATQRLAIYPPGDPTVVDYTKSVTRLTNFFKTL